MLLLLSLLLAAGVYFWLNGRKFRREGQAAVRFPILNEPVSGDGQTWSLRANLEAMKLFERGAGGTLRAYRLRREDGPSWECREESDGDGSAWQDVRVAFGLGAAGAGRAGDGDGLATRLEAAYQAFLRHHDPAIAFPDADKLFEP